jgi:hypothetical protein
MRMLLLTLLAHAAVLSAGPRNTLPLFFIANEGQAPPDIHFMSKGSGVTVWFLPGEVRLRGAGGPVRMQFQGANPDAEIEGLEPLPGKANFLNGGPDQWLRGVALFGRVIYRHLYPGIDMIYGGNGRNLKSEFIVAPGADPSLIAVRYLGAGTPKIDAGGALAIPLDGQPLLEEPPRIYQERGGKEEQVQGRFELAGDGSVRFHVGRYDASLPLIIDPLLSYSTLLGGSGFDSAVSMAVDSSGATYLAGYTDSYDFPTANPEQNFNAGGNDAFVAKLNPAGNGLVYCTYVGGSGDDRAYGIAVDAGGYAYVTGSTVSLNFPTRNALQSSLKGWRNAFVFKLNPAGNTLVFSTYLGGNGFDYGYGIALDAGGNAYVAGDTTSLNFPATGFQKGYRGIQDAFVAKIATDGSRLLYSTYLGGGASDHAAAIAVDVSGTAYITGSTYSLDFPTKNAFQASLGGGQDAFVARLSADGGSLLFSTYLGGSGGVVSYPESGLGVALDAAANVYVTGVTGSPDFPLLHPLQLSRAGSLDAFVSKLNAAGALMYSTYLGGYGVDVGNAIAVDRNGAAVVVGYTYSTDLPVVGAIQSLIGGDCDAFVAKLSATGDSLVYMSYLGGNGSDTATAVALDAAANVFVAGWTLSTNFPLLNPYQTINYGNYGAYVTKIVFAQPPALIGVSPNSGNGVSQTFSFQYSDSAGATDLTTVAALFNSAQSVVGGCSVSYSRAQNALSLLTDAGLPPGTTITPGSGSQQNSQCILNGAGSSVSLSGTTLTLNLALTFLPPFAGAKNVYMQAVNPNGTAAWQQQGVWTVGATIQAVSVAPSSGSGASQIFSLQFSDSAGATDLTSVSILVNSSTATVSACSVTYKPALNTLALLTDAGALPGSTIAPGSGSQQNSQCALNGAASSVSTSGNLLTLSLSLVFQTAFSGVKNVYMQAGDAFGLTGWLVKGTYTVQSEVPAVSVSPASGTGGSGIFSFQFSDPLGATDLASVSVLFNTSTALANACSVTYNRALNTLTLLSDSGAPSGSIVMGNSSLQNSQCSLTGSASSVSSSGNVLTLNLAIGFKSAFSGSKNVYSNAQTAAGQTTGWQVVGTWTVSVSNQPPQTLSVNPSSGSGSSQTFSVVFSDVNGPTDLASAQVIINNALSGVNACYVWVEPNHGWVWLANDSYSSWPGPLTLGTPGTLQNSQCTVNVGASSGVLAGNTYTLNLVVSFPAAFAGLKNIYGYATNLAGLNSMWQPLGTWTVH